MSRSLKEFLSFSCKNDAVNSIMKLALSSIKPYSSFRFTIYIQFYNNNIDLRIILNQSRFCWYCSDRKILSTRNHYPYTCLYLFSVLWYMCHYYDQSIISQQKSKCVQWLPGRRVPYEQFTEQHIKVCLNRMCMLYTYFR